MILDFIRKIINIFPAAHRAAVERILASKRTVDSPRAVLNAAKDYESQLAKGLSAKPKLVSENTKITSTDHNYNMENIYAHLNGLTAQAALLGQDVSKHLTLIDSEFSKARTELINALSMSRAYALKRANPDYDSIALIKLDNNNTTLQPPAWIEPQEGLLRSSVQKYIRAHTIENLPVQAAVELDIVTEGEVTNLGTLLPPELMLDYHLATAWAESILAVTPITQVFENETYYGPIFDVKITAAIAQPVNHIRLVPFSEFPFRLVKVQYKSAATAEAWIDVPNFASTTLDGARDITLPVINVAVLRLIFNQENYKQITYRIAKDTRRQAEVLAAIIAAKNLAVAGKSSLYVEDTIKPIAEKAIAALSEELEALAIRTGRGATADAYTKLSDQTSQYIDSLIADEETIEITRFEYAVGLRSLEFGLAYYEPKSYYETTRYLPNTTIADVYLHVEQTGNSPLCSTAWSIDFGNDRIVSVLPGNTEKHSGLYVVNHERLDLDLSNHAISRFPVSGYMTVYENAVPMTGYYTATNLSGGRKDVLIHNAKVSAVYTATYETPETAALLDIGNLLASKTLDTPDKFTELGPDNDVVLNYYPYVEYSVVNDTGHFVNVSDGVWSFQNPQDTYSLGHLRFWPTVKDAYGRILITGMPIASGAAGYYDPEAGSAPDDFENVFDDELSLSYFTKPYGYYVKLHNLPVVAEVTGYDTVFLRLLKTPEITQTELDQLPSGLGRWGTTSGDGRYIEIQVPYYLGVGIEYDNVIYGFDTNSYEPLKVYVGGQKATNRTDYVSLEHPAMTVPVLQDTNYEYIHAGNKLYFNQPITNQEISVSYNWVTRYMTIRGLLYSNAYTNAMETPIVSDIYALVNTSIL